MGEDAPVERGQRDVDAGRPEVRDEDVPGVGPERQPARRPAARAGPDSPSVTRPRSTSSPTRCATIARPSPVRATSSDRDRDRPSRISSRTVTSASSASSASGAWHGLHARRSYAVLRPLGSRLLHLTGQSSIRGDDTARPARSPRSPETVTGPRPGDDRKCKMSRQVADPTAGEPGMTSRIAGIGTAVIGTGFIGTVHVEALRRIGVQVRGVLGSTPERGAARAEALGVAMAYASLDELLADPTVDVVHVTSPNDLHVAQSIAVLASGRHVVCEKPLALTAAESARLVAARRGQRPRQRGQLQHPPLPVEPARPRGRRGRSARRGPARDRPLLPGLAPPPRATGTGGCNRTAAARSAPWATSARTGST